MPSSRAPVLAVLASGRGSNFEALAIAAREGGLGTIRVLLCDRPGAPVLERARRLGIEALCLPPAHPRTRLEDEQSWVEALREREVGTVLLAGFMRRLHSTFLDAFPDRILNLHPSLLPAFPGLDAIRRAFEHGARVTGCTVHLVDAELDHGPILAQRAVPILDHDRLDDVEERVHEAERALYPEAVRLFLGTPWRIEGRRLVFEAAPAGCANG